MTVFRPGWDAYPAKLWEFYQEFHINTLTTLRPDGRPHVVPVGVMLDPVQQCAWIITRDGSRKVANIREWTLADERGARVAACQVAGPRWSTIEGWGTVRNDEESVSRAVELYSERYERGVQPDSSRVAVRIEVEQFMHSPLLLDEPPVGGPPH